MRAAKARQQPGQAEVDALTASRSRNGNTSGPRSCAPSCIASARAGPRDAAGFPASYAAGACRGREVVNGVPEAWSLGYLTDVILTRDPWMHRLDLARATGRDLVLTADHDGVIVADIVAEWARRHGRPYRLELTGPAGGSWSSGTGGEEIVMDAADFCRIVSGRPGPDGGQPWGLLATQVPF